MRKIVTFLFAMFMVFATSIPTMAAAVPTITGEAQNSHGNQTDLVYTYYVMMKAGVSNGEVEYYVEDEKLAKALLELTIDGTQFCTVTRVLGKDYWSVVINEEADFTEEEIAAAFAEIKDQAIESGTVENYKIELEYGALILIESNIGTRVVMEATSVAASIDINGKYISPTIDLKADTENAEIGGTINYTITVGISAEISQNEDIIVYDTLSKGLTLGNNLTVVCNGKEQTGDWISWSKVKEDEQGVQYCMKIPSSYIQQILQMSTGHTLEIKYSAALNDNAVVNIAETNASYLEYTIENYGKNTSTVAQTSVYTFGFKLNKVNGNTAPLEGVKFTLTKEDAEGTKYYTKSEDGKIKGFQSGKCEFSTDAEGKISFDGLAAGTYTLTETETAVGYMLPENPIVVNIAEDGKVSIAGDNSAQTENGQTGKHYYGTVTVKNSEGVVIAETGGAGTGLFYIMGSICVCAAGMVFMILRRSDRSTVL